MVIYNTPRNLVEVLNKALKAASHTEFYKSNVRTIKTLADYAQIPSVALKTYRNQKISDILVDPSRIDWIVGSYSGNKLGLTPILESSDQTETRYDLLSDALKQSIDINQKIVAVAISSQQKIGFAAEISTILTSLGISTHLVSYTQKELINRFINITRPQIIILLSEHISENDLPNTVKLCITFRQSHTMTQIPQLDMYLVEEIGFMAHSNDCRNYLPYKDVFYFEQSDDGYLIVSSLNNFTKPLIRIKTGDTIDYIDKSLRFKKLGPA